MAQLDVGAGNWEIKLRNDGHDLFALLCWIKALLAHSGHCRAMGRRIAGAGGHWSSERNERHLGEPIPVWPG